MPIGHSSNVVLKKESQSPVELITYNVNNKLSIFPNPSSSLITIRVPADINENRIVNVFNVDGKIVYYRKYNKRESNIVQVTIDVTNYVRGIYYVKISGQKGSFNKSFVVH
jgi:hypothetical protein